MTISFKNDDEGIDYVLKRLIEMKAKLSVWESGFVHNLEFKRRKYTGGYELSEKQLETLSKIWEKY